MVKHDPRKSRRSADPQCYCRRAHRGRIPDQSGNTRNQGDEGGRAAVSAFRLPPLVSVGGRVAMGAISIEPADRQHERA